MTLLFYGLYTLALTILFVPSAPHSGFAFTASDYEAAPPFATTGEPPLVMLVLGRNHKLYYEAYNDASDLNNDGILDVGYNPAIEYYGYFDSYKYYQYSSSRSRFEPKGIAPDKKAPDGNYWSGDWLNYMTMTRMDCLRKVLYGGFRSTDTSTETVLQRVYVPQDAHSWGKEYESVANDGYNIEDYTPLSIPSENTRHLFASTTLSDNGDPIFRVLPNSVHRIWEWVAKERPVADDSLEKAGGVYDSHPNDHSEYNAMVEAFATAEKLQGTIENNMIDSDNDDLSDTNPFDPDNDNYLTIIKGTIRVPADDTYQFAVDGDDAVEVIINGTVVAGWYGGHGRCNCHSHSGSITLEAGDHTIEYRHEEKTGGDNYYLYWNQGNSVNEWQIVPASQYPSGLTMNFYGLEINSSTITDYDVRVKVGDPAIGVETNSKRYPSGVYKPIGLLQRHGENNRMYFGLLTGSYTKNTSGGVLRKNVRSITDEINSETGEFLYKDSGGVEGIIKTIDALRIVDFDYGNHTYNSNCGWITGRPLNEGECRMWGNPVAEMMYETLRYFAGHQSPTPEFTYGSSSSLDDNKLGLPKPEWLDPYTNAEDVNNNGFLDPGEDMDGNGELNGFKYCAKPFMLVLSDINPTYDSDQLPGAGFTGSLSSNLIGLDVKDLADTISIHEGDVGTHFIGEAATDDGACTPKDITGFGSVRGLCPEEPTKQGSYYSASVAYHGIKEDIHKTAEQDQNVTTYAVGLASPLPRIEILVGTETITVVPFAKSVGGYSISSAEGDFQPTNTIVDFFVEEISPTYGKFRINYEDVEQGADHDMDAIVEYEYQVVDNSDNPVLDAADGKKVIISLNSIYAAGSIIQHMGYIISGTSKDGTYLEVRDKDTGEGSDPDYFLDTPPGEEPGGTWNDGVALPLTATRTFTPGSSDAATLLKNPLWYAAKWGGFEDLDGNNFPNLDNEWDGNRDEIPDTYFYVQNPLMLEEQLNRSFADILRRSASGTAASVISHTRSGEGAVYQALFYPEYKGPRGNTVNWVGEVHSLFVDSQGNMREDTDSNARLDLTDRIIKFDGAVIHKYEDTEGDSIIDPDESPVFTGDIGDINYLWSSTPFLNKMSDEDVPSQRIYSSASPNRYIFTFVDADNDMVADDGEQVDFKSENLPVEADLTNPSTIFPYLTLFPSFEDEPAEYNGAPTPVNAYRTAVEDYQAKKSAADADPGNPTLQAEAVAAENIKNAADQLFTDYLRNQSYRVVNYIRGVDQGEYNSPSYGYTIPKFRSRQVDYDDDGTMETWRLGDIVYSTPTEVGRPAENYHLLYRDTSYATFADHFKNRRHVIYTGANDGMFHAFNAGFFNPDDNSFVTQLDGEAEYALGSELWAYVPYNLLPHLYWLTEEDYDHVYYSDAKPKVFDAKVFDDDTHYTDTDLDLNWGTILVSGMRFGGGEIIADMDKKDGASVTGVDRTMSSAFFILDITDPESAPKVLAEIKFEGLGYTTCYPVVIPMKDKEIEGSGSIMENEWYLVFGSGPASAAGKADGNGGSGALSHGTSQQPAKLFVLDLKELVQNGTIKTLDSSGVFTEFPASPGLHDYYQALDSNSFVSDPINVDFDLDYNSDVVYFGTVGGNSTDGWKGKMRRIVIDNNISTLNWNGDSVLMDLDAVITDPDPDTGQPITASPTAGVESNGIRWVYWGTGRYLVKSDSVNVDQQSYYGIKEPFSYTDTNDNKKYDIGEPFGGWTWATVSTSNLFDSSNTAVYDDKSITGAHTLDSVPKPITQWDGLIDEIDESDGWYLNFSDPGERNLGQAALLAELLTFTTYVPSVDICSFEGESYLYGLYYKTGTAYFRSVIGSTHEDKNSDTLVDDGESKIKSKLSLGPGLAATPNIHVGRQDGSKAFIQTSTGAIEVIEQINPASTKSGVISWEER